MVGLLREASVPRLAGDMVASSYRRVQMCARLTPRPVPDSETDQLAWQFLFVQLQDDARRVDPVGFRLSAAGRRVLGLVVSGERGEDLGVEPVRFEELPRRWPGIAARMGMPGQPLPHVNGAPAKVEWTREAIELVDELCWDDVERVGY